MQFKRIPLSMLFEGAVLASGIRDQENRLLLAAGAAITQDLLAGLYKRGVRAVVVTDADWQRLSAFNAKGTARDALPNREVASIDLANDTTTMLDAAAVELEPCGIVPVDDPFSASISPRAAERYSGARMTEVVEHHRQTVNQVQSLLENLKQGQAADVNALADLSQASLVRAADDLDLFVCMGINPLDENSIFAHSTQTAMLAIAIGATLGLSESSLRELGMGCMVHDSAMLDIDPELIHANRVLTPGEFYEIAKHPIVAADRLARSMKNVPPGVQMVVYQMHERCDGSGYPRGCTGARIHPLAKIASVADAYVALISSRPHRRAMLPYYAIKRILEDVAAGRFDPSAVRGLLHTVSLFPLGSFVEMSNNMVGKTIRANGPAYERPVVEAWNINALKDGSIILDLSEKRDIRVIKPLTGLR